MPLELLRWEDMKQYIEDNPQAHVFYKYREGVGIVVTAGKVVFRSTKKEVVEEAVKYLIQKDAVPVAGWVDVEEAFQ